MKPTPPLPPKILIVDDSRDGLLVRKSLLEEAGCSVETADSAEGGLRLFQAHRFDVVVTDYRMPRMNGMELIQRIRRLDPQARIVLISDFVETLGLTEEATGADVVIAKSASEPAHLVRSVRRLSSRGIRKPPSSQRTPAARARATWAR
jgi:CheY-like chemotaxis protein